MKKNLKNQRSLKLVLASAVIALVIPTMTTAQTAQDQEARAAELMCQVGGICGDLAKIENNRVKQTQGGKSTRAMMSIGAVKSPSSTGQTTSTQTSSTRRVIREAVPGQVAPTRTASVGPSSTYAAPVAQPAYQGRAKLMVNFALGSADLTDNSQFEVLSFAAAVKNIEKQGIYQKYRIEGHADSSGTEAVNLPLSDSRAAAVRDMLVSAGVPTDRIEFAGYGSQRPLPGLSPDNALNRRVEAVLVQ